uniref:C2H2-type domain-containing protein n=1 Tax=Oryzias melastigma TaxID=30732 RepID=A0A3B3C410_ORYME
MKDKQKVPSSHQFSASLSVSLLSFKSFRTFVRPVKLVSWCLTLKSCQRLKAPPSCVCVPAVLPQHWSTEEDLCNQQRNFRVDQENPEPPQTPEELQDPEPSPMKEEPGELCISQDEEQLDLKQETETLMEIPALEEHVVKSTSTPDEETEPQNRDQRKRRDRSHVQSADKKPFLCKVCDKRFTQSVHLKLHMGTHTGEKLFSCKQCHKSFSQKCSIKRHMRIHTGEKPFLCKVCDKCFTQSVHLKLHMGTHTGEKLFSCKQCHKSFSQKSRLSSDHRAPSNHVIVSSVRLNL